MPGREKEHDALVAQMRLVYWLLSEEMPHTTKLTCLMDICKELG